MHTITRTIIALGAASAAWSAFAQVQPPVAMTNPDWRRKPSINEMTAVYPSAAKGRAGGATINCIVTKTGLLRSCRATEEYPQGSGYGLAALSLSSSFMMKPATVDGQPVEATVSIPVKWEGDFSAYASPTRDVFLIDPPWAAAPTYADLLSVYPTSAKPGEAVDGLATLRCRITKQGTLSACVVVEEGPKGRGYGSAARKLVKHFKGTEEVIEAAGKNPTYVNVPFSFPAKLANPTTPINGKPRLVKLPGLDHIEAVLPPGTDLYTMNGRAVVNCAIGEGGVPTNCGVRSQEPNSGYGDAALALAPHFRISAWTTEGLPVLGSKVNLPITFKLSDDEKADLQRNGSGK